MKKISCTNQNPDQGEDLQLRTRVFELCKEKHKNLSELGRTMNMSEKQLWGVRQGKNPINQGFIIRALRAFPDHNISDLFYLTS